MFKLMPLSVLKNVLLTVTLSAFETGPPKLREGRAGRATQVKVLTVVKVDI